MKFDSFWRNISVVEVCSKQTIDHMIKQHYLGKWPGVVVCRHVMLVGGEPMGCVVWALPPRETAKRYGGIAWELARLWVDDVIPRNAETWLISKSIKMVRKGYPGVKVLVSYADPSVGHTGVIYRAANWVGDGMTDEGRKTPRCDYVGEDGKKYSRRCHIPDGVRVDRVARVSKYRYVYWLGIKKGVM